MQESLHAFFKSLARKMNLEVREVQEGGVVLVAAVTTFSDWWATDTNRDVNHIREWFRGRVRNGERMPEVL